MCSRKKENSFQPKVIERLEIEFPEAIITKQDANYIQGIPDLAVFYKGHWAWLETKRDEKAKYRPNQEYYLNYAKENAYGSRVEPENLEEVICDLQRTFGIKK